jgi:16S rRNA G966 N2-methylase RsmD
MLRRLNELHAPKFFWKDNAMTKKSTRSPNEQLFEESLIPAAAGSGKLFDVDYEYKHSKSVECLGMTFPNEDARRKHFTEQLREKLADPEFRGIDGFPLGTDDDIIALSDPPYYTACPNPFVSQFVEAYGKVHSRLNDAEGYHQDPFAADVSEGKNDPIYNAHSYHTKVPHKAIIRYILHYTNPGDLVFDGFAGTGMTGLAAQLCADLELLKSLGYVITNEDEKNQHGTNLPLSKVGRRYCVLSDLSPAASFISHNYNTTLDTVGFLNESERILQLLGSSCGWMCQTQDPDSKQAYPVTYTIWSDVFSCPECGAEIVFWDVAVDDDAEKVKSDFQCQSCKSSLQKNMLTRVTETAIDFVTKKPLKRAKQIPVVIEYIKGGKRFKKKPDESDTRLLQRIETERMDAPVPTGSIDRDIDLWYERDYRSLGISDVSHFYTVRALRILSEFRQLAYQVKDGRIRQALIWMLTSVAEGSSRLNRERPGGMPSKLSGTLYVGGLIREINPIEFLRRKAKKFADLNTGACGASIITTQSSTKLNCIGDNSIDYIFTDPPFGSNIIYSDLSILWESWLGVLTNTNFEAVVHRRKKNHPNKLEDYFELMLNAFKEMNRVLKPERWITVEFHNTKNTVWNVIQEALQRAGFVIADVRILDKMQGSFKQLTAAGAVKKDLVISAYKPAANLEDNIRTMPGNEEVMWEFVTAHLRQLPTFVLTNGKAEILAERQKYMIFDRMIAFHVQRGVAVPLSASEFYAGLERRYVERNGMYFLASQSNEYDQKRAEVSESEQLELFVSDERSAIQWVRQNLADSPKTYQELSPLYMREAQRVWEKHEEPIELQVILDQNFIKDDSNVWRVADLKRESDLEQLRNRALLKEFQHYVETKGKLKIVRSEALRAGFKDAWQKKDYATIVQIAKRIPDAVVQEDPALLMYFDNASLLLGE